MQQVTVLGREQKDQAIDQAQELAEEVRQRERALDATGALVGITTFFLKDAQNLNFAIAADEYWH
jgi:hypothetical protein